MPVTKSAKKKLRQDKKKTAQNSKLKTAVKTALKKAKQHPSEKTIRQATSLVDKAQKKNIIHKNKVARIKATLAKLISKGSPTTKSPKSPKKEKPKKIKK